MATLSIFFFLLLIVVSAILAEIFEPSTPSTLESKLSWINYNRARHGMPRLTLEELAELEKKDRKS